MEQTNDCQGGPPTLREQDRYLPIANISRIMKRALPNNAKIAKDAKETVQECVSEFISFITSEASDKCQQEKRKTINGEDILWAMQSLGFDSYYEPLKLYFEGVRFVDLQDTISPNDLFNAAKPEHKLLMKIYTDKELRQYFDNPFASKAESTFQEDPKNKNLEIQDDKLNLRSKVISSEFAELPSSRLSLDVVLKLVQEGKHTAKVLDLSYNQLLDCDMSIVAELARVLQCEVVDISVNRFHGIHRKDEYKVADYVKQILQQVKILNIVGNPFASIDKKEFFMSLSEEGFQKLVWIPKSWLTGLGWKQVAEKYQSTIQNTHDNYYKSQQNK